MWWRVTGGSREDPEWLGVVKSDQMGEKGSGLKTGSVGWRVVGGGG